MDKSPIVYFHMKQIDSIFDKKENNYHLGSKKGMTDVSWMSSSVMLVLWDVDKK